MHISTNEGNYIILFEEVVDFSSLAASYCDKADELKSRHQSTIHTLCEKYHGELLDLFSALPLFFQE